MSLIFSYLSCQILSFVLLYIYKVNKLKLFCKFTIGCFVFSNIYFVLIINESFIKIPFLSLLVKIILSIGIFFCFIGIYEYVKKEFQKHYLYIIGTSISLIIVSSLIGIIYINKNNLSLYLFGILMIIGCKFCFSYFKRANVGKFLCGIPMLILGVIYLGYAFNGNYRLNEYLSYFIEPIIFLVISTGLIISHYEVTKKDLEVSEKRYRLAMEGSNDGLWEYDLSNNTTFLSPKTLELIGLNPDNTIIDLDIWKAHIHPEDIDKFNKKLKYCRLNYYSSEYRIKSKSGEYRWILSKGKVMLDEKGEPVKIIGSHTDTTDRKKTELKMYSLAYYDQITNLPNRTLITEKIKEIIIKSNKFAVLVIGVNGLKTVNDSLGRDSGDDFLKIISDRLKAILQNNVLGKFDGDHFVVLNNNYKDINELELVSRRILKEISKPNVIKNCEFYLSGSIGIAIKSEECIKYNEILRNAELAMHKAREKENNSYIFFDNSMNEEIHERIYLEKSLHDAVQNNEFVVYYQLQKDINNNRFTGAEALVRWMHPSKGLISPVQFIPLAEKTGLIISIGEYVLRESCKKAKELHNKGYKDFTISVNVSSIQLQSSNFVSLIQSILEESKLEPKYLTLEITESIIMKSLDSNIKVLEKLRKLGVTIALDDFGTGYSSFNYLLNLPIDILKIDKSFVDGITESSKHESIFSSIVYIAKNIELNVVAEGVETNEQLDILRKQKCDKVQGYIFSKPIPEYEVEKNLDK